MDDTVAETGGARKVVAAYDWHFLDMTDGHITCDPPVSASPAP
jgi:hypothetical protein